MQKEINIVTHNSGFHTDDIFAVATLLLVLGEDNVKITRSRDMDVIKSADYVVDVGGIHSEDTNRFDHHQEGGAGKRENGIPYASFGLVWKKFGEQLTGSVEVKERIDRVIVQPIDANDNGVQFLESKVPDLRPFDIGFITHLYYPTWKEDLLGMDSIFLKLVAEAKAFLTRVIKVQQDGLEAQKLVLDAYNSSTDKRIVILENSRYPWEEVLHKFPEVLYVIYKNMNTDTWTVKGLRKNLFAYDTRKRLPESWAGKMDSELEKITGVPGSVFCHNARFMAVNKTKEGILKMAEIALNS